MADSRPVGQLGDSTRHFLVTRSYGKLARIVVFDDVDEAVAAYEREERMCGGIHDCVLLGADRLATCIATHGNWFDEPNRLLEELSSGLPGDPDEPY